MKNTKYQSMSTKYKSNHPKIQLEEGLVNFAMAFRKKGELNFFFLERRMRTARHFI